MSKQTESILKTLKDKNSKNQISWMEFIPVWLASGFSIFFSLSLIKELANNISGISLIFIGLFITFFVVWTEVIKVVELQKIKPIIFKIILTLTLSTSCSCLGVYFWTNKTIEIENKITTEQSSEINNITQKYKNSIDSINSLDYFKTYEYLAYNKQIISWKRSQYDGNEERKLNKDNIIKLESQIINGKKDFNNEKLLKLKAINDNKNAELNVTNTKYNNGNNSKNRNNFISIIFFILVFISEFIIFYINRHISNKKKGINSIITNKEVKDYKLFRDVLSSIYINHEIGCVISINTLKENCLVDRKNLSPRKINQTLETYVLIGLLDKISTKEVSIYDSEFTLKYTEEEALDITDQFFDKILEDVTIY